MTCYVDPLMDFGWFIRGRRTRSCHLTTDGSPEELHTFAERIGMRREWFQEWPKASIDHYDLTPKSRALAISIGAVELDRREAAKHHHAWHEARRASGRLSETEKERQGVTP